MKSAKIDQIMKLNNIEIALPSTFSLLTNIHMRIFFIQEWEKVFDQIGMTFDEWFHERGHKQKLPKLTPADHNELSRYRIPIWPMITAVLSSMYQMELENIKERTSVGRQVYVLEKDYGIQIPKWMHNHIFKWSKIL